MIRKIVVLPLPDAPSSTSTSPSATSKLMFSSTLVLPKRLLMPSTLAAAGGKVGLGSDAEVIRSGVILTALAAIEHRSLPYRRLTSLRSVTRNSPQTRQSTVRIDQSTSNQSRAKNS